MIAETLGATLLHSLWQIGLLVCVLAALSPVLARLSAQVRYLTYCLALLSMPVIALVTFAVLYEGASPAPTQAWAGQSLLATDTASSLLSVSAPWLVGLWLIGVAISTARVVVGCTQVKRLRASARPLSPAQSAVVDELLPRLLDQLQVRAKVAVAESLAVTVPTLVGWLRPVILCPVGLITQLSRLELEAVIAHELGHVRRLDPLVNVLQSLIEALFFYHPGARWLSRRIRDEREYCCDDLAVRVAGDPIAYAYALTELEARRAVSAANPSPLPAVTATAINPQGGALMTRIRRLVQPSHHSVTVSSWFMPGFLAMVIASAALTSACEADTEETGQAVGEIRTTGTATFIGEDGEVQQVEGDHVWFSYRGPHADGEHQHEPGDGDVHGSVVVELAHSKDGKAQAETNHKMPANVAAIIKKRHHQDKTNGTTHAAFVHEDGEVVELSEEDLRELHEKLQSALHGEHSGAEGEPRLIIKSVQDPTEE